MTYLQIVKPAAEPVTLEDVKTHLRISDADEDTYLTDLIAVARDFLERDLDCCLITQSWRLFLDSWPENNSVSICRFPLNSIDAVHVYDVNGDPQLVPPQNYHVDVNSKPARMYVNLAKQPQLPVNGIEIDFTAGFGVLGQEVPDTLRRALLLHIGAMFELRSAVDIAAQPAVLPAGYERLIAPFRRKGL